MPKQALDSIAIRLIYDGGGPLIWSGDPHAFGVQDKAGVLHLGTDVPGGKVVFDLTIQVKRDVVGTPAFHGEFVHGPPTGRFLYLGWRNPQGAFAQRLKLPLSTITWTDVQAALAGRSPLVGTLIDHNPKATSTGANIGGSRPITWVLGQ